MLTADQIAEQGYKYPRLLPTGEWIALFRFAFTWGVVVGIDEFGYKRRFCYESANDALKAVALWDGSGDPPGRWIVEKPGNRQGPGSKVQHKETI